MSNVLIKGCCIEIIQFSYLSPLDQLRFWACLIVLFHHFRGNVIVNNGDYSWLKNMINVWLIKGSTGVSLFLVLSAFLFTLIAHAGSKKIIYHKFVYNRILRIFPLVVFLVFIVIAINRGESTPMDIFRILTLQLNTGHGWTGWGHNFFPIGPIWTVAVEFQFYLLFPFLILFSAKYGIRYILLSIVLMWSTRMIISEFNHGIYYNLYHTIIGRLDQFLIGILLGILYIRGYFNNKSNWVYAGVFCLSLVLLTAFLCLQIKSPSRRIDDIFSFTIEAIIWSGIIISYMQFRVSNVALQKIGDVVAFLGTLSFSIYLLHLPVGIFVNHVLSLAEPTGTIDSIVKTLVRIPFIFLGAYIVNLTIERPFMGLRVKYFQKSE